MNWRNTHPRKSDYETEEEYNDAVDSFYDAIESDYEEKRLRKTRED